MLITPSRRAPQPNPALCRLRPPGSAAPPASRPWPPGAITLRELPIELVNAAPYNPRKNLSPRDPGYQRLLKSVATFGLVEPLIWNKRTGHLVGGHQRFKILLARGAKTVPASVVDLPLAKEQALNLALNKPAGEWDHGKLAELLDELIHCPDLDLELTGFGAPEVAELLAGTPGDPEDEPFNPAADLERGGRALTRAGELLALGAHRVLCGDATNPDHLRRALGGKQADLLWTDPPYNVAYTGDNRPTPRKAADHGRWAPLQHDRMSEPDYAAWLTRAMTASTAVLAPGGAFYFWNSHKNFGLMHSVLTGLGLKVGCVITWAKESFAPGFGDYNQQTEFCLYGWKPGKGTKHRFFGPRSESTLWRINRERTGAYEHSTQKPLELAERAIRNSTVPGGLVLDPFLGSGTALAASARLGRRCAGLEIEPRYCDVIARRFISLAGADAVDGAIRARFGTPLVNEVTA
jgi:DNA modification methylase